MIKLSYTQYKNHFKCQVENIKELSVESLQALEAFATSRSGRFDYETESFSIPKRIEMHHLQELFHLKQMDVFITQKEPNESYIADTATINFGKFKGSRWSDLDEDYLRWLSKNLSSQEKQTAIAELERRKNALHQSHQKDQKPKELSTKIGFGKYRGQEWQTLPQDYLSWVASNLQGEVKRLAELALSFKK